MQRSLRRFRRARRACAEYGVVAQDGPVARMPKRAPGALREIAAGGARGEIVFTM
ncbi:hypothetical protein GCM10022419_039840 [Nonomuraea rosea]|uniref:Uncharacterized protein n=1 Tax=Nonomuraea rosea TaxID=638574 RepID=A0ABP6WTK2_9ACTN